MIPFRTLSAELGVPGGHHDLEKVYISRRHLLSKVALLVSRHEDEHDSLIRQTTFGTAQFGFRQIQLRTGDQQLGDAAGVWVELLMSRSRFAHEVAATYLSIRSFSKQEGDGFLEQLPPTYREYHDAMTIAIEPEIHGTFAQYVVAKAICHCAFNSPMMGLIDPWSVESPVQIPPPYSPDLRLRELLKIVSSRVTELSSILLELAKEAASDRIAADFDVFSDDDWECNLVDLIQERTILEDALSEGTVDWLVKHAEGRVEIVVGENMRRHWAALLTRCQELCGQRIALNNGPSFIARPSLSPIVISRGIRAGHAVVDNREFAPPHSFVFPKRAPSVLSANEHVVLSRCHKSNEANRNWLHFAPGEPSPDVASLTRAQVVEAFLRTRRARSRGEDSELGTLVVGLEWEFDQVAPTSSQLVTEFGSLTALPNAAVATNIGQKIAAEDCTFPLEEHLVWYLNGNAFTWYEAVRMAGSLQFLQIRLRTDSGDTQRVPPGVDIFVFKFPGWPGFLMRAMARLPALEFGAILSHDERENLITPLQGANRSAISKKAQALLQAISILWSEF